MKTSCGFTLIEMMIAMALAVLLFGVALPALSHGLEAARALDARADLLTSLTLAANKASLTGTRAVLCPSADGRRCLGSADWSEGWIVFLDTDGDREMGSRDALLQHADALAGKVRLRSTAGRTRVVFEGDSGNAGSNVTFTICDGRGPTQARALILSNQGRLREAAASAAGIASTCVR
jgi:type IV fimbrial biogenesis protein FimT